MRGLGRLILSALALGLAMAAVTPASASEYAAGQSRADYLAWLAREPAARERVVAFRDFLHARRADRVVPTWQLLRTASMWRDCSGPRFEVAPRSEWQHIATTLSFVRTEVEPLIGRVEALSGYRNETLNKCAGGARQSAHRHFYALDLMPLDAAVGRAEMIHDICKVHSQAGRAFHVGLGFYSGRRFHVDSKGFRRWGPDGRGATSPCATGLV